MKQKGQYPAIRLKRELYSDLKNLKYELKVDSFSEVLEVLLDSYIKKKKGRSISLYG